MRVYNVIENTDTDISRSAWSSGCCHPNTDHCDNFDLCFVSKAGLVQAVGG